MPYELAFIALETPLLLSSAFPSQPKRQHQHPVERIYIHEALVREQ